mmetsp:Transcript_40619/g.71487  ORF Transcript_40619/g.71487 Transcript_40619/m.71487 type:complete len:562 (+) Transcript_40619:129-1814(+)
MPTSNPADVSVSNDPFLSHSMPVTTGGPRAKAQPAPSATQGQDGQELVNVASDAFMIKPANLSQRPKLSSMPTVKVNIISASNLRAADWLTGKSDPFVICQVPRKSRSQFRTKTINKDLNPVWNEYGHPLPGWVPGDPIKFSVFDADTLKGSDPLGEAMLASADFFPNGWQGTLTLKDDTNTDAHGTLGTSTLQVSVEVFGVTAGDRFELGMMRASDKLHQMEHGLEDCMTACAALPAEAIDAGTHIIGEGDPERKHEYLYTMILVPWGVFLWILLVWLILRHFTMLGTVLLTTLAFAICIGAIIVGITYRRGEKTVPFSTMGMLCLLAVCFAIMTGQYGWSRCWRQYWWTITGIGYQENTAATPAASRIDAAYIGFTSGKDSESTLGHTSVDTFRAAGFRSQGTWYCAAPILSPSLVAGTIWTRVEYWAIGVDCCQDFQSFTCDASREYQGGYGVVMLDGGMPCAGCNSDKFRKATQKAEGRFNLVSSPGARYVRFVRTPGSVRNEYLFQCLLQLFSSTIISAIGFAMLGKLAHFKGIGKKGRMPNFSWGALTGKQQLLV